MDDRPDRDVIRRHLDTTAAEPSARLAELVGELKEKDVTDMKPMWACADHVLDHLFSNPPSPEAQMKVEFLYEGYHITVEQNGSVQLVQVEE